MSPRPTTGHVRRPAILTAAAAVIAELGVIGTRIADVAERADTSAPGVLYWFASKDELLTEALAFADDRFYAQLGDELGRLDSARARLARIVELWLRAVRHPELRPTAAKLYARMKAWFKTAIEVGGFGVTDAGAIADRTLGLIDGLGLRALLGDPEMPLERARAEVWHALAGDLGLRDEATSGYVH